MVEGILIAYDLPYDEITPQVWQREFNLGAKYPTPNARKNAHKLKAKELFPDISDRITLDVCDALLIAEYGYRRTFGELTYGKNKSTPARVGTGIQWDRNKDLSKVRKA